MDDSLATLTKAVVAFIPHESLRELMARFPNIAAAFWRNVLINAGIFREWLVSLGRRSAFEQVAHLFCELYLKLQAVGLAGDYRCPLPITQRISPMRSADARAHQSHTAGDARSDHDYAPKPCAGDKGWDELLRVSEFDSTYLHLEGRADDASLVAPAR